VTGRPFVPRRRRLSVLSRENRVLVAFGALALLLGFGGLFLTSFGGTVLVGVMLVVGVVVPTAVNEYLDRREDGPS
jgi:hypothetical protein